MQVLALTQGQVALIDDTDAILVLQHQWYADRLGNTWYAATRFGGKKLYLHRLVLNATPSQLVDHIDCNGLNCQKSNLRFLSKGENTMRRGSLHAGYKGVTFDKSRGKWIAKHSDDGRGTVNLGRFKTAEEAAQTYDSYVRKEFGQLAYTNFTLKE